MAQVEKYYTQWYDTKGVQHEIKLLQKDAVAGTTAIQKQHTTPCTIRRNGSKDNQLKNNIWGTELLFKFHVDKADISSWDTNVLQSDYKDWSLEKYKNSSLEWIGWIKAENCTRSVIPNGGTYLMTLSATDGLADLQNIEYLNYTTGYQYNDRASLIATVKRALEHIEISLDFRVQLNTWETSLMAVDECALVEADCDNARSTTVKEGIDVNDDCYTMLQKTLKDFNCILIQSVGYYWIINPQEIDSYYYPIDWTNLSVDSGGRVASDLEINIDAYKVYNRGELQKVRPYKQALVKFLDRNVQDNLLTDGGFDSGVSEWNSNNYFTGSPAWADSSYLRQSGLNWEQSGFDNEPTYLYTDNESITKVEDGDQIYVSFKYRIQDVSPVGVGVWMYPRIYDGSTEHYPVSQTPLTGNIPLNDGSTWQICTASFLLPGLPGANNYSLRIYTKGSTTGTPYTAFDFEIDDVYWVPIYVAGEDVTFDRLYAGVNTDDANRDEYTDTLYFGDSAQDSDIGGFHIGATRSSTWRRFGKTEGITIQEAFIKNVLENYARHKNYVRLRIEDGSENIKPHSLLSYKGGAYIMNGYEISYHIGKDQAIEVEATEVLNTTRTIATGYVGLSTVDGKSTESGGSTIVSTGAGASEVLNDAITSSDYGWSSSKITSEINSEIPTAGAGLTDSAGVFKLGDSAITETIVLGVVGNYQYLNYVENDAARYQFAYYELTPNDINYYIYNSSDNTVSDGQYAEVSVFANTGNSYVKLYAQDIDTLDDATLQVNQDGTIDITGTTSVVGTLDVSSTLDVNSTADVVGLLTVEDDIWINNASGALDFKDTSATEKEIRFQGRGAMGAKNATDAELRINRDEDFTNVGIWGAVMINTTNPFSGIDFSVERNTTGVIAGFGDTTGGERITLYYDKTSHFGAIYHYDGADFAELRLGENSSPQITIDPPNARVGINDTTPSYSLDVSGTFRATQDSVFDADVTGNSFATTNVDIEVGGTYIVDATGTIKATDFYASSDIRYKDDVRQIDNPMEIIRQLLGVRFTHKKDGKKDIGLIHHTTKNVLPEITKEDDAGMGSINYGHLASLLLEGIKEQDKELAELKSMLLWVYAIKKFWNRIKRIFKK